MQKVSTRSPHPRSRAPIEEKPENNTNLKLK